MKFDLKTVPPKYRMFRHKEKPLLREEIDDE